MTRRRATAAARVDLEDETRGAYLDAVELEAVAAALLELAGTGSAGLSLRLVGDAEMRRLNRVHMGRDRTTNVLSFPLEEGEPGAPWLGDVVLAPATIGRRARAAGRDPGADVAHLLAHGLLHLMGHDHVGSRAERERMRARERELLAGLATRGLAVELRSP